MRSMTSGSLQCAAVTVAAVRVCGNAAHASACVERGTSSAEYGGPLSSRYPQWFIDGVGFVGRESLSGAENSRPAGSGSFGSAGCAAAFRDRVSSVSMKFTGLRNPRVTPAAASRVHLENDHENDRVAFVSHRAALQSEMNGLAPEQSGPASTFHDPAGTRLRHWSCVPAVHQPIPPHLQSRFTFPRSFRAR